MHFGLCGVWIFLAVWMGALEALEALVALEAWRP